MISGGVASLQRVCLVNSRNNCAKNKEATYFGNLLAIREEDRTEDGQSCGGVAMEISAKRQKSVAMPKILQNHYVLAVHNNQTMSRFFADLGFEVILEPPGWVFLKKDDCMVMLGECPDAIPASELGDHNYFAYLRVDDADGYHAELVGKGLKILSPLEDMPWGMREFSLISPEGHRIRFGEWVGE